MLIQEPLRQMWIVPTNAQAQRSELIWVPKPRRRGAGRTEGTHIDNVETHWV